MQDNSSDTRGMLLQSAAQIIPTAKRSRLSAESVHVGSVRAPGHDVIKMCRRTRASASGKALVLGVARTGAKYTPHNHANTGDPILDLVSRGDTILCMPEQIEDELRRLYGLDVRYIHEHARNPVTREQSCDIDTYATFGRLCARLCPDAVVSFGASRNGPEIDAAVAERGEWARIEHVALPVSQGGAHFVTAQAAVELQIVRDMERKGFVVIDDARSRFEVLRDLCEYMPSAEVEAVDLPVFSTARGRNYGSSSAETQLAVLKRSIAARHRLGLPFEVEWVQGARSAMLTWYLAHVLAPGLRQIGRLNITVLFGFSPRLPFPQSYAEFKAVIDSARAIATVADKDARGAPPLQVSVTCGAAVLPQHAHRHIQPIDVGPLTGIVAGPLERLVAYASQADSGVDVVRVGMEDTPYMLDPAGVLLPTTNLLLAQKAVDEIERNGATIVTDVQRFRAITA